MIENKAYDTQDSSFEDEPFEKSMDVLLLDIDGYEGPIDVLLQLTKNQKIDITKISILELVGQYLDFIKKAKLLNLELASDYLVMASWLAFVKSKCLIPEEDNEDSYEGDISEALAFNLKRIKSMRDTSEKLFSRKLLNLDRFYRGNVNEKTEIINNIYDCNMHNFLISYSSIINKKNLMPITILESNFWSIDNAIFRIKNFFKSNKSWFNLKFIVPALHEVENNSLSKKIAWASTLAASLELAKSGVIEIEQKKSFGEVLIKKI